MERWLLACIRRPVITLFLGMCLAGLSLVQAQRSLRFTTDRTQLLDARNQIQQDWAKFRSLFGRTTDYIVLVRAAQVEQARRATDELGQSLVDSPYFEHVFYRLELGKLMEHGLYFLSRQSLQQLATTLRSAQPWLNAMAEHSGPASMLRALGDEPIGGPLIPMLQKVLGGVLDSLKSGGRSAFRSPLGPFQADVPLLQGQSLELGRTTFHQQMADGRTFMVVAMPRDTSGSFPADVATLGELERLVSQVRRANPEASVMITGEPAINTEEMIGAIGDARRCAGLALALVSGLLLLAFGQIGRPLWAVLSLLISLCWSIGFAALTVGQLNLLTVHFVTILTGLGITFGIQMLSEFQLHRGNGLAALESIEGSLSQARHQAVGAVTTAIAFYSLQFTSFRAAAELGWVTGTGVLLCYLGSITLLPSLLLLSEGNRPGSGQLVYGRWLAAVEMWLRLRARGVCLLGVACTLVCLALMGRIPFDYNLLKMQPPDAEATRVESYLQSIGYSTLYGISLAPNAQEARRRSQQIQALPSVSRVESILALEPNGIESKNTLVTELVELARGLKLPQPPQPLGAPELLELQRCYLALRPRLASLNGPLAPLVRELERHIDPANPGPLAAGLGSYQAALVEELRTSLAFLKRQRSEPPDLFTMLPKEVLMRGVASDATVCLRVFPKENCWEREPLGRFVAELSHIDPHITGTPVLIYSYLEQLRLAYRSSGRNALLVICLLLIGYYRSLPSATLALLPKLVGVAWMLGAMALLGSSFNAANFLALPLTLGIGLIFGMESLRICQTPGRPLLSRQSTGFAVVVSGLTTIVGFSTLMMANHRGVASFGEIMALGLGMNLLTSLVLLPACYGWWHSRSGSGKTSESVASTRDQSSPSD